MGKSHYLNNLDTYKYDYRYFFQKKIIKYFVVEKDAVKETKI
jgi:hypothetical protein